MEHQKSAHSLAPLCFAPLAIFCGQSAHADSPRKISSMTTGESSLLLHFGFLDGPRRLATVSKVPRSIALCFFVLLLKYIFPYKAIYKKKTIGIKVELFIVWIYSLRRRFQNTNKLHKRELSCVNKWIYSRSRRIRIFIYCFMCKS